MISCKKMQIYSSSWDGHHIVLVRGVLISLHVLFSSWISNSSQLDWQSTIANELCHWDKGLPRWNQEKVTLIFKQKLHILPSIQTIFKGNSFGVPFSIPSAMGKQWFMQLLGDSKPLPEFFWPRSSRPHGVTRPQYIELRLLSNEHILFFCVIIVIHTPADFVNHD